MSGTDTNYKKIQKNTKKMTDTISAISDCLTGTTGILLLTLCFLCTHVLVITGKCRYTRERETDPHLFMTQSCALTIRKHGSLEKRSKARKRVIGSILYPHGLKEVIMDPFCAAYTAVYYECALQRVTLEYAETNIVYHAVRCRNSWHPGIIYQLVHEFGSREKDT